MANNITGTSINRYNRYIRHNIPSTIIFFVLTQRVFPTGIPTVFAPEVDRESSRDFEWTDL